MKKRTLLKQSLAIVFAMWMVLSLGVFAAQAEGIKPKEAKYIILIIGDGMNIEHEIAASRYLYGKDFELSFHKLPYQADVATWDVTTYEHWCGKGSYNPNSIKPKCGYDPAIGGKTPYPLGPELPGAMEYHIAKAAAHVSHNQSRNNYHAISEEILKEVKPEGVIGAGYPTDCHFRPHQQLYVKPGGVGARRTASSKWASSYLSRGGDYLRIYQSHQ